MAKLPFPGTRRPWGAIGSLMRCQISKSRAEGEGGVWLAILKNFALGLGSRGFLLPLESSMMPSPLVPSPWTPHADQRSRWGGGEVCLHYCVLRPCLSNLPTSLASESTGLVNHGLRWKIRGEGGRDGRQWDKFSLFLQPQSSFHRPSVRPMVS